MSDIDKLLSRLDSVDSKLNDFEKSKSAANEAVVKGVDALKNELNEERKNIQELAQLVKSGIPQSERQVARMFGEAVIKSASEGTDADGGYLVNDELTTAIKGVQNQYGTVRKLFGSQIYPMQSDVTKVPVDTYEDTDANAPVPASTSENAAISESNVAQIDQVSLTAAKYATLSYVSNELLADSFADYLGAFLMPKLARKAAKTEDKIVFTTATTGLLATSKVEHVTLVSGKTAFGDMTVDDLYDMQDAVVDDALENGMYIMHRSVFNILRKLKDDQKQYIVSPAVGNEPPTLCGYGYEKATIMPARTATAADTGFLIFGDITKGCVVGERNQRQIVTSNDFRFNYDQTAVRMTWRFAFNTNSNLGKAICVLKTAASMILAFVMGATSLMAETKYDAGPITGAEIIFPAKVDENIVTYIDGYSNSNNSQVVIQQRVGSPAFATSFASGTSTNVQANNAASGIAAADVCVVQHPNGTLDYRTVAAASTTNVAFTAALSTACTNGLAIYEMENAAVYHLGQTNTDAIAVTQLTGEIFKSRKDSPLRISMAGATTNLITVTVK